MSKIFAVLAFAIALPMSNPAHAYIKCDEMADAKKKKKCEKNMSKSIAKARKNTKAIAPSALGESFGYLDSDNPLDTDDWYVGVGKIGVKKVDRLNKKVAKIAATVKLAKYAAHLNKTDKEAAAKLGGKLLPELVKLEQTAPEVLSSVQSLASNPQALLSANPSAALKIPGALAKTVTTATKAVADLPGAIGAITPIAKGAGDAAIGSAVDKATGAAGGALDAVKDAAGQ